MSSPHLSTNDRAQLSALADEFHASLVRGRGEDWAKYLSGLPQPLRTAVLTELVLIDLSHRWATGERPTIEEYVARFPEFGPVDRIPPSIVLEEYRCRVKAGEAPDLAAIQARFPKQYPTIQAELESRRGLPLTGTMVGSDRGAPTVRVEHSPTAADYEFVRVLGRGVFGEVWLARKTTTGIEKAIKILTEAADHETASRERRSLELIKNLRHPYLLATEDFWVADNRLHIVMELADSSLRDELRRCREAGLPGIPPAELLGYLWEAAEGLDFLHSHRVIHRDVKPANILLLHGHAKVADFGLARSQEEVYGPLGTFAGTPAYMAPEAWGSEGGPASDQYGLAITYAELRQGTLPIRRRPLPEMLIEHAEGGLSFADIISPGELAVLRKAIALNPEDRYPSCRAFLEAMCAELGHSGVARSAPRLSGLAVSTSRRWKRLAMGMAVIATGLGLWGWLANRTNSANPDASPPSVPNDRDAWLPVGAVPVSGAKVVTLADGKRLYEWIERRVGNEVVRFRLITAQSGPQVAPFYMMESKVWNGLFATGGMTPASKSLANGSNAPVTFVTRDEAADFAQRVLGGQLPSPEEWDHATGLYAIANQRDEVTQPSGRPHVWAVQPAPTQGDNATTDVNAFGLRDMAGNGREWTSGNLTPDDGLEFAILRGRMFTLRTALTFEQLRYEQTTPQTQFPTARSPYTSFRVVIPVE